MVINNFAVLGSGEWLSPEAAKNIGMKLLTVPEGKRPSGLSHGQLALKSGTLNLSDDLSSAEFRPEGESHGQTPSSNERGSAS
jgi:putative transposase